MSERSAPSRSDAIALTEEVRRLIEPLPEAAMFLAEWPALEASRTGSPSTLSVLRWLDHLPLDDAPETRTLVGQFVASAARLTWRQTYVAGDFGGAFLDRYGWTELIGLRGPIASDAIACGFLMLGPATEYPAHAHEAEELYLPLSGRAWWQQGKEAWHMRAPGEPVHHPSWTPHAMRTEARPLLALYLWRGGDLRAKSQIVRPS